MKMKHLLIFSFFSIILLFGCRANNNEEENEIFNFTGIWMINSIEQLCENNDEKEDINYLIGNEIQIGDREVNILGNYEPNIHYKLKAVESDYTLSYENNLTMSRFMNGRESVDLISIIDKNQIVGEFFLNSDTEMILLYKSNLFKLNKISKNVNFEDIKSNTNIGNETENEQFNVKEGVMIGIKTPAKEIRSGIYGEDEYRTIWISHENWNIGSIYEKPNIIFPRLNGIWQLESIEQTINGFEYTEFKVGKYDEKLKSNFNEKLNLNKDEYKTIKFVGNDYIAIGKYEGDSFEGNYPIYQIIPVNNINIENGLQTDEIFNGSESQKYLDELQNEINSLSKEELEKINTSEIDYNNIAIERRIGKWTFVGNLLPKNMSEAGKSFKISILPDNRFINYNSLYISWKMLKQQLGFFKDAFISPLGEIALIQFDDYIAIYKIENGNLITEPLYMIQIGENDEIIMSEWASGSYVDQWENAFLDGELISEN